MESRPPARTTTVVAALALCAGLGLLATLAALTPSCSSRPEPGRGSGGANWVTSSACAECHPQETEAWRGSHHDLAMQEPTPASVLGDFGDTTFEHLGATTRFFRRGDAFMVEAEGPDGEMAEFKVRYVFGVEPLQQYLLELPGGWIQSLTVAWDTEQEHWFTLYPDERHAPDDPLHWSGRYQAWNTMCAECHSTGLDKGYDLASDTFATTFEEIDVACEACHGPGDEHVQWAKANGDSGAANSGDSGDMGLSVLLRRGEARVQLDTCSPCHSRRAELAPDALPGTPFLDAYLPELLRPGSYFPDGQIHDEVYVWGSFTQSKMHQRGVACTDCHDPHSLELVTPRNSLCAQCHSPYAPLDRFETLTAKNYDTPEHHFHPDGSPGAQCVNCHMPERTYMQVDPRRDHSLRVPRPDLTVELGTPNACNGCHADESADWAAERVEEWYGPERAPGFALAMQQARNGDAASFDRLIELTQDEEQPVIARATALEHLRGYPELGHAIGGSQLSTEWPLLRQTAVAALEGAQLQVRLGALLPLVEDPVLAVRIEAARQLVTVPRVALLDKTDAFDKALAEWVAAQEASSDMPWAHFNLGALYKDQKDGSAAAAAYVRALEMDGYFLPARFNLATLYNGMGRNLEAERVLRDGIKLLPNEGELHYSLGLLLAEVGRLPDAAGSLLSAAELMPGRARVQYNAGLALHKAGREDEAELALLASDRIQPDVPDVVHALALLYESQEAWELAAPLAERLVRLAPDAPFAKEFQERITTALEAPR